ncbi:MAG: hypothetical protein A2821_02650 [Candidatus Magasanikbacteria bacterium RIFCSPHIGHO2_01_FULL_41_23]|uniref:DNA polymerase III subunit delta n=1 Tax=Candidatus Magasanikbacteria bacterium RIFCSPLOWO2_01_FULL_40_15 TaxID=1798686 RepID=A0A1F6N3C5_9BACT|nr:MAG: hypothetical protein A2821_02650 [Candidatus Magasanikbacteria bacterium RIFCSPHIGHO2_01_FULL_41_23]OGH66906.1 MAG: hypothetical protein A3C66_02430 [Candidatus Magasanikbacteria bacterium RIFCSPHIGHO2_02_FULL_41_35]OGH74890.1 MAG: hypothetical protein A3F22_04360 [Candidatus Magasanikbacteria bacterium RIFCSPHIGHO2_12_FULL_41_16]OGH78163.1 MAG: hypothetical protein A2983_03775 [Candidatus Magasanikbacteria bacterium RIFCSPLOWO2_01_FULL_40_15]
MSIIGHKKTQDFFTRVIDCGILSHAYAFIGSDHIGKETLAIWIASLLLKTVPEKVSRHLDVRIIRRQYDEKNNRFKRDIAVAEMRDLLRFASQSSFQPHGWKVVIIVEAERLNVEAGNAILKILEEPPERTVFFLLYQNTAAILPTIHSRVQTINLARVSEQELSAGLLDLEFALEDIQAIIPYAQGLPGQAITWLREPDIFIAFKNNAVALAGLMSASITQRFGAVEPWFVAAKDEGGVDYVVERLEEWRQVFYSWLNSQTSPISLNQNGAILDELEKTILALRRNAHPPLAVQSFLLSFP